jgi:hypothetical protein
METFLLGYANLCQGLCERKHCPYSYSSCGAYSHRAGLGITVLQLLKLRHS